MKLKDGGKPSRPPINGGTYLAVCVYSIQIGEQLHKFSDKSSYQDDVVIGFELAGVTYDDDGVKKPYDLGKTFNASKHPNSALHKMVNAWNGREMTEDEANEFDTNDLVGRPAMLNVMLKENGFNEIQSVMQIPAGLPAPVATMPLIRFDMDPWDQKSFDALPEWAQNRIKKSTEYQKDHVPVSDVAVQPQTAAGFQMPQNIPGIDFSAIMQQMAGQAVQPQQATVQPTGMPGQGGVAPF